MIIRFANFLWCRIAKPTYGSVDPVAGELRIATVTSLGLHVLLPGPGDAASRCRSLVLRPRI